MKRPPTYTIPEAQAQGFQSITVPYLNGSKLDQIYLTNVLRDMQGVAHCLIEVGNGVEVGRLKSELL
jgi:hypothetical protein